MISLGIGAVRLDCLPRRTRIVKRREHDDRFLIINSEFFAVLV